MLGEKVNIRIRAHKKEKSKILSCLQQIHQNKALAKEGFQNDIVPKAETRR